MIVITDLKKKYGKQVVLDGINISIGDGTIHGLVGKNGAGKSTLLSILGGIIKADSGKIAINVNEILTHNIHQLMQIGCVFEKPLYIEKLTGFEFLFFIASMYKMPNDVAKKRVNELLFFFELNENSNKLIENYSKGMRSKISLATAIIHYPKFLFLDEPFDGIDTHSILKVNKLLKDMAKKGTTIIVTSHQKMLLTNLCDEISILEKGIII